MPNQPSVQGIKCGESRQSVAFALMQVAMMVKVIKSKEELLDLYEECLVRTADPFGVKRKDKK